MNANIPKSNQSPELEVSDAQSLIALLKKIDRRGYKAYVDLKGKHTFPSFTLFIDHVQGDPFAAPSRIRIRVDREIVKCPEPFTSSRVRVMATADWLARQIQEAIHSQSGPAITNSPQKRIGPRNHARSQGSGKSGLISIDAGGQEVLERTAIKIHTDWIEARMEVGLPAAGRKILASEAIHLLTQKLPEIIDKGLIWDESKTSIAKAFIECIENQEAIRKQLSNNGLIAFVADGAVLPRRTGVNHTPMPTEQAIPFYSPDSLAIEVNLPNAIPLNGQKTIRGMGVRTGITLIVGGGYHGKSTLLSALENGVYPHIPGDGREYVVSSRDLVKVRSEDGRSISGVDIHAFIDELPSGIGGDSSSAGIKTHAFSTQDASGSTSQAAAIAEAVEAGAHGLLLDEDTSATNFMLRDSRMQKLVHAEHEPITPFLDRVRELYHGFGVSSVLVMGGSGDYFDVADSVIMMKNYRAHDVTLEAQQIASENETGRRPESKSTLEAFKDRYPMAESIEASRGKRSVNISTKSRELILYGEEAIDLRYLTQIADTSQTHAIAWSIHLASTRLMTQADAPKTSQRSPSLKAVLDQIENIFDEDGLDVLGSTSSRSISEKHPGRLARPRRHEISGALSRLRCLRTQSKPPKD